MTTQREDAYGDLKVLLEDLYAEEHNAMDRLGPEGATAEDLPYEPIWQSLALTRIGIALAHLAVLAADIRDTLRIATRQEHL